MKSAAWTKLEKFNREKFPKCVKELLINCAYDTLSSLSQITPDKLQKIESFLNNNKRFIILLKCCYEDHYKSLDVFEFLPGHKEIILAIPNQIQQMKIKPKMQRQMKSALSDDELKTKLVTKLILHAEKIGIELPDGSITDLNVIEFERGSDADKWLCKCRFVCPVCAAVMAVKYETHWKSGNLTSHFNAHINEGDNEE